MVICVHLSSIFLHLCRKKAVILQPNFVRTRAQRLYACEKMIKLGAYGTRELENWKTGKLENNK